MSSNMIWEVVVVVVVITAFKQQKRRSAGTSIASIGLLILIHTAYSAAQHRSYLRIIKEDFVSLPADLIVQLFVGFFISLGGIAFTGGKFFVIDATKTLQTRSVETLHNIPHFYSFKHRGKFLTPMFEKKKDEIKDSGNFSKREKTRRMKRS